MGLCAATTRRYVAFLPLGMACGCLKNRVLVPLTDPSARPCASRELSLALAAVYWFVVGPLMRWWYSSILPVSVFSTALSAWMMGVLVDASGARCMGFSALVRRRWPRELV